jgi:hypothetical protein
MVSRMSYNFVFVVRCVMSEEAFFDRFAHNVLAKRSSKFGFG